MNTGESVDGYFSRTLAIANRMRIHGDKMEDVTIIEKILRSMSAKFNYVVCSIEESHNIEELSIDELQSSLLLHEQRMVSIIPEEQVLKVSMNGGVPSRGYGRGGGKFLFVCLYVDDLIYTGNDGILLQEFKDSMKAEFEMTDLGAVSWSSRKQQVVTLSTTEAEFIAAATSACQAIWLRRILDDLHFQQHDPTIIHCDSSSAIKLSKNPVLHGRSKHIDVRYHFLRDLSNEGTIELVYCRSEDQIADIMTKALKLDAFEKLRNLLGMCSFQVLEQED
ncbi:Retrovirus-related polyprotein from transposon [Salix suchowensis]|nr:Retrovirus-related polyprotein from transposon [Salix suchowensis]